MAIAAMTPVVAIVAIATVASVVVIAVVVAIAAGVVVDHDLVAALAAMIVARTRDTRRQEQAQSGRQSQGHAKGPVGAMGSEHDGNLLRPFDGARGRDIHARVST